ncbi:hypothetical protein Pla110_09520 [Polystyrenella longa]|uniref:DUF1877 family protein n=1 Tax=Polystyrenella longa TaxID=2528007 RepID=A0A518CJ36_9PLAN|nr:DUF1877 family protein [Polystyrenella longa]QDU79246.1 hypothetical protein Pla110_09520 [Polystyrenella longa]
MNTHCTLYEILPEEATRLVANDPEQFYRLRRELHGDVPNEDDAYVGLFSLIRVQFLNLDLDSMFGSEASDSEEMSAVEPSPREIFDLGEAWHGLHYILTGDDLSADPPTLLDFLVDGGDHWDWGEYGYRFYTPVEVAELSSQLEAVPAILFKEQFQPEQMKNVHPKSWGEEDALEWLIESFVRLRAFLRTCAEKESGIAITMT